MTKEGHVLFENLENTQTKILEKWFSIYCFKSRPWDPSRKLDLAICHKSHQSRALYDFQSGRLGDKRRFRFSNSLKKHHGQRSVSFYLSNCDPSKKLDLAICYKSQQSRALYDLIWPTWWQKKDGTLHKKSAFYSRWCGKKKTTAVVTATLPSPPQGYQSKPPG